MPVPINGNSSRRCCRTRAIMMDIFRRQTGTAALPLIRSLISILRGILFRQAGCTTRARLVAASFKQTDSQTGALYQYLNSLDVYRCNIDDGNWASNTIQVVTSYIMNGAVCDYGNDAQPEKLRAFKPSAIFLWEIPADISESGVVNDGADQPKEEITTRHFHGSTVGVRGRTRGVDHLDSL